MYIVKAEAEQIEKIVNMSIIAFETDVNVGGAKGDCPPGFDSAEWHQQMAREGHLYQAMIGKELIGAAIVFPDETKIKRSRSRTDGTAQKKRRKHGPGGSLQPVFYQNIQKRIIDRNKSPCRDRKDEKVLWQPVLLQTGVDDRRSSDAAIADPVPGLSGG